MRIMGTIPVLKPPAAKVTFGDAPETDEDVRKELAGKLMEKGIGPNLLTHVMGMPMPEGYEIFLWTHPGKMQNVMDAMADLTGVPKSPNNNRFLYKGRKVSVWQDTPLGSFGGGIGPFGPPQR